MQKILLASDGTQFSDAAFDFARQLNELQPILLTGVFMPQVSYASLWSYTNALGGLAVVPLIEADEKDTIRKNIRHFENLCRKHKIAFRVHKDLDDFALPELRKETRFADLLILSSEKFYQNILGGDTMDYVTDVLKESECPVLVVPEKFNFPTRNVIAYDGSASAVYAIKQFVYLFPELCKLETTILYLDKDDEMALPDQANLEELVQQHFKNINLKKMDMDPKKHFSSWLGEKKHVLLIGGSFGRSSVSQLFRRSFLHDVVSEHELPVFIAHK
ncbi:MAG: hypothetical protein ICV79_04340 [Flavisolibacter sp.]|nr:hypothetical protein [Flavisolibacter sp.]